jgi:phosphocarrier protein
MSENQRHEEIEVTISNVQGLHARPVMRFVDTASRFNSQIRVEKQGESVDGKSPMEMMLLEAVKGTVLRLVATGDDAIDALQALADLINSKFGEE